MVEGCAEPGNPVRSIDNVVTCELKNQVVELFSKICRVEECGVGRRDFIHRGQNFLLLGARELSFV